MADHHDQPSDDRPSPDRSPSSDVDTAGRGLLDLGRAAAANGDRGAAAALLTAAAGSADPAVAGEAAAALGESEGRASLTEADQARRRERRPRRGG